MFRNPVGEFRLSSGKASGRSFRPQCEALEERIVLDTTTVSSGSDSFAPSSHTTASPLVLQKVGALTQLATSLGTKLAHDLQHELDSPATLRRVEREGRQFLKLAKAIGLAEGRIVLSLGVTPSSGALEPQIMQLDPETLSALNNLAVAVNSLRQLADQAAHMR